MSDDGMEGDDYVFGEANLGCLPSPVRRWLNDLTYDEWHGILLGTLGVLAPIGVAMGYTDLAVYGTAFLVATIFGFERRFLRRFLGPPPARHAAEKACNRMERVPIARRLLRSEPWYFLVSFLFWGVTTHLGISLLL